LVQGRRALLGEFDAGAQFVDRVSLGVDESLFLVDDSLL
jgi:hypothetical protein